MGTSYHSRMAWIPVFSFSEDQDRELASTSTQARGMGSFLEESDGFFTHHRKHGQEVRLCKITRNTGRPRNVPKKSEKTVPYF